jgi:hypothetical protein
MPVSVPPTEKVLGAQEPFEHTLPPVQTFPQLPQLFAFVSVLTSQPSATTPLQSSVFAEHEATPHAELKQKLVAFATAGHALQLPQCPGS